MFMINLSCHVFRVDLLKLHVIRLFLVILTLKYSTIVPDCEKNITKKVTIILYGHRHYAQTLLI